MCKAVGLGPGTVFVCFWLPGGGFVQEGNTYASSLLTWANIETIVSIYPKVVGTEHRIMPQGFPAWARESFCSRRRV